MNSEVKARGLGLLMLIGAVPFGKWFILDPLDSARNGAAHIIHYNLRGIMVAPLLVTVGLAYVIFGAKVTEFSRNRNNWGWKEYLILLVGFVPVVLTYVWFESQINQ